MRNTGVHKVGKSCPNLTRIFPLSESDNSEEPIVLVLNSISQKDHDRTRSKSKSTCSKSIKDTETPAGKTSGLRNPYLANLHNKLVRAARY